MPRDARVCEAKKPTVLLSVILRISILTGGDVADSQKMALKTSWRAALYMGHSSYLHNAGMHISLARLNLIAW